MQCKVNRRMDNEPDGFRTPFEKVFKNIPGIVTAKLAPDNTVTLEVIHDYDWGKQGRAIG